MTYCSNAILIVSSRSKEPSATNRSLSSTNLKEAHHTTPRHTHINESPTNNGTTTEGGGNERRNRC